MSRIVVIGAGIGGMSTAARLATLGHSVAVFEGSAHVGGKCRTEWIDGYAFDTGPTLLTLPAVYRDFFLKTGDALETVLEIQEVNPSFDYRFIDGSHVQFANLSRFQTLKAIEESFGNQSSYQWNHLMLRAEKMWDASREKFIEAELRSWPSLLKNPQFFRDLQTIAPWKSLRSLTHQITHDSRLQYIAERYATYSGSDPRKAPAVLLSIAFVEEAFGAWHIKGGIGQLAYAIHDRAVERGVTFHCGQKVVEILHDGTRTIGIRLADGASVKADLVVANADASQVYSSLLKSDLRVLKRPRRSIARSTPSSGGFSLFLGLKKDPMAQQLSHHTILFPADYETEFESIFTHMKPAKKPAIYICSPNDPLMVRRDDTEAWSVLVNTPPHSTTGQGWDWNDREFSQSYANTIIDQIESRGIAIRNRLELMEIRTPADLERETFSPGGSIYGTSSNGAPAAFWRAKNRSPLHGLFCVGGSAHPGGGLPLVGISAEIVANTIDHA
ncbi:MAG TPA: NAD(P)/FAD-dependent oxidoreductase [Candidatus Paceibacterota bacterium]|nr:NAD(P)/FAD-dependent oxidoreductase [Candidatus Paceibacterota bacterium]